MKRRHEVINGFSSFEIKGKEKGLNGNVEGYLESEVIREILFCLLCCDSLHEFNAD